MMKEEFQTAVDEEKSNYLPPASKSKYEKEISKFKAFCVNAYQTPIDFSSCPPSDAFV